ncbi:GtrA family protein [Brevundimonas bacteroides]|uniref:GtrA family protein n=1 Tax=Brevundimonas bacteroides TaxID=74311 RepID=UPI0004973A50|nr:GtrA family protein [Brevundimonas bacteroides]
MKRNARYMAVVVVGFGIDLGLALVLNRWVGLDLKLAAAGGFVAALIANYLLFETWVFRANNSRLSVLRLMATAASALIALGIRLAAITGLTRWISPSDALTAAAILVAAAALSLLVNWALVSRIFNRETEAR